MHSCISTILENQAPRLQSACPGRPAAARGHGHDPWALNWQERALPCRSRARPQTRDLYAAPRIGAADAAPIRFAFLIPAADADYLPLSMISVKLLCCCSRRARAFGGAAASVVWTGRHGGGRPATVYRRPKRRYRLRALFQQLRELEAQVSTRQGTRGSPSGTLQNPPPSGSCCPSGRRRRRRWLSRLCRRLHRRRCPACPPT